MAKKTIKIKNYSNVMEELVAAGTITPGMILGLDTAGKVVAHAVAGGNVLPLVACEDELRGKSIADNYVATDPVQVWVPGRGDMVYALLSGANVVIGDQLQSNGDGTLAKYAPALANATLSHLVAGNGLKVTARIPGTSGNLITLALIADAEAVAGSEVVAVGGTDITVTFQTATSTIAQVITALQGNASAKALVVTEAVGTTSGAITALAETALTGGAEVAPAQVVAQALEAVSPSGEVKRIQVRIV